MAAHQNNFTTDLAHAFALITKALNIPPHNNNQWNSPYTDNMQSYIGQEGQMVDVIGNQQGNATGIQMGNQMQYAGQHTGIQMDQFVNQNGVNHNENYCFMTSSATQRSDIGRAGNVQAMDRVEKLQYMLILARKRDSGIPLTAEESDFLLSTRINQSPT